MLCCCSYLVSNDDIMKMGVKKDIYGLKWGQVLQNQAAQ